ncbi:MAG: cation transporter [Chromatiaceae bacterium]|jgi:cation diffusion facilitator family transporter|nr:cation transporter [Candidatus Thioaporhodococcus sediminis]
MSGFSSAINQETKQRLLSITLGMEIYTLGASTIGMFTSNSIVFIANFVIALTGALAAALSLYTVRRIARGVDLHNTYGYGRLEMISTAVVALTMIMAVLFISYELAHKIDHPVPPEGGLIGILLTSLSFLLSLWLWFRNLQLSRAEHAPIFEAMWRMMRMGAMEDFLIITAVGSSLLLSGFKWAYLIDVAASIILIFIVMRSIGDILSGTLGDLIDRSLEERDEIVIVRELVNHFDDYEQIHGFRSRRAGSQVFVELFLEFHPDRTMGQVYAISARLKAAIRGHFPNAQVLVIPSHGGRSQVLPLATAGT